MRITSLLAIVLSFVLTTYAQTYAVFLDDTLIYHIDKSNYSYKYQFNDSLSDGNWVLYDLYRKDSLSVKKLDEHILLSETFKGRLRHGRSYWYKYSYSTRRHPHLYLSMTIDYQDGKIEGMIVKYQSDGVPAYEWSVSNNQLDGICVTYDTDPQYSGTLLTISYFEKDSLIRWNDYKNGYELIGEGKRLNDEIIEYTIFENNKLKYKCYYKNYYLERYYEYSDYQVVKKADYGPFYPVNMRDSIFGIYHPRYTKYEWMYWFYVVLSHQEE